TFITPILFTFAERPSGIAGRIFARPIGRPSGAIIFPFGEIGFPGRPRPTFPISFPFRPIGIRPIRPTAGFPIRPISFARPIGIFRPFPERPFPARPTFPFPIRPFPRFPGIARPTRPIFIISFPARPGIRPFPGIITERPIFPGIFPGIIRPFPIAIRPGIFPRPFPIRPIFRPRRPTAGIFPISEARPGKPTSFPISAGRPITFSGIRPFPTGFPIAEIFARPSK
nr:arachin [Arachis hypogaea]